jgi:hypothetical protein
MAYRTRAPILIEGVAISIDANVVKGAERHPGAEE